MTTKIFQTGKERRIRAYLHDQAMGEKYSQIHGLNEAYNDFYYWYELDNKNPCPHRDYPLPYSHLYLGRFLKLFFSRNSEAYITENLAKGFVGDETDAQYIGSLLITAKDYGLFTPRAILEFDGEGYAVHLPPPNGAEYPPRWPNTDHTDIYQGGGAHEDRRKVIETWLERRAEELRQTAAPATVLASQELITQSTEQQTKYSEIASSLSTTQNLVANADKVQPFLRGVEIDRIDEIANLLGLTVGVPPKSKEHLRVHALSTGIIDRYKIRPGADGLAFRRALAERYGVTYVDKYNPQSPTNGVKINRSWNSFVATVMQALT